MITINCMKKVLLQIIVAFQDLSAVEKESLSLKLENARNEGVLIGKKQQREFRDMEIKRMEELLDEYKSKCGKLEETIKMNEINKTQLEAYNRKADNDIKKLIELLKEEQGKQKNLDNDLKHLKSEVNSYKTAGTFLHY